MTAAAVALAAAVDDLAIVDAHATQVAAAAQPARVALAELEAEIAERDYPRRWVDHLVAPYRAAVDHADRLAAFVARARDGRVAADDLARAAEAVRSLSR